MIVKERTQMEKCGLNDISHTIYAPAASYFGQV